MFAWTTFLLCGSDDRLAPLNAATADERALRENVMDKRMCCVLFRRCLPRNTLQHLGGFALTPICAKEVRRGWRANIPAQERS
ncbi:MAG: hypothetical protein AAFY47_12965 [Pseudomonadota bacterium]